MPQVSLGNTASVHFMFVDCGFHQDSKEHGIDLVLSLRFPAGFWPKCSAEMVE